MRTNADHGAWVQAQRIAFLAMGKDVTPGVRGRPRREYWRADEDPLAWWALTEWIMAFRQRKF
jgi:hypothetical protein